MSSDFLKEIKVATLAAQSLQREEALSSTFVDVKNNIRMAAEKGNTDTLISLMINEIAASVIVNTLRIEGFTASFKRNSNDPRYFYIDVRWM